MADGIKDFDKCRFCQMELTRSKGLRQQYGFLFEPSGEGKLAKRPGETQYQCMKRG